MKRKQKYWNSEISKTRTQIIENKKFKKSTRTKKERNFDFR